MARVFTQLPQNQVKIENQPAVLSLYGSLCRHFAPDGPMTRYYTMNADLQEKMH